MLIITVYLILNNYKLYNLSLLRKVEQNYLN